MLENNFNQSPEPIVTVNRRLVSKYTVWYVAALVGTMGVATAYWYSKIPKEITPVAFEVVDIPLTEAETDMYRDTLDRISSESTGSDSDINPVVLPETAVIEVRQESADAGVITTAENNTFIPPVESTTVDLVALSPASTPSSESVTLEVTPKTAYLEGDVTILDFKIDSQSNDGSPIQLNGVVYANDTGLQRLQITSGGVSYTVQTDVSKVTTRDGKTISQANLKTNDIIAISGRQLNGEAIIIAQTITLTGVQEYKLDF